MQYKIVNFRADRISGWVYDPEAGDAKSTLDVLVNGDSVATLTCNVFRSELPADEFTTRNIGFLGSLPPEFWTGETHVVSLRDRRTGRVLEQTRLETADLRIEDSPGFLGEFALSAEGSLGGWLAQGSDKVTVRLLVDGQLVDDSRANRQKTAPGLQLSASVPPGYAYVGQIPPEFFDDAAHQVQVIAAPDTDEVSVLEQTLELKSAHASHAADKIEENRTGKRDWAQPWRKAARVREDIAVIRLELTPSYAAVTLSGTLAHNRAVLRLGDQTVLLAPVDALHPEDRAIAETSSLGRYAGEIPTSVAVDTDLQLFVEGAAIEGTYDLRMGDESGRRPAALPDQTDVDIAGRLVASEVSFDAAALEGWVFNTARVHSPLDLSLRLHTFEGVVEIADSSASERSSLLGRDQGVIRSGAYSLLLPLTKLPEEPSHLELVAIDDEGEHLLWSERQFVASDEFLIEQGLATTSVKSAVRLVRRARAAGRSEVVHGFLRRHEEAASRLKIADIEKALTLSKKVEERLEPTTGAIWYWVRELRENTGRIQWFTQNAVRNRMGDARDVLAYATSKGRFDFSQLHGILESLRADLFQEEAKKRLSRDYWTTAALCLARFLYSSPRDEIDYLDALTLYRLVEDSEGPYRVRGTDRAYYGELLTWRKDFDAAWHVLSAGDSDPDHDYSQKLLALNAVNPHQTEDAGSTEAWWAGFNALIASAGVSPLNVPQGELSFYNLPFTVEEGRTFAPDGPLVSVIVPVYEPSEATNIAVKSLLSQTWNNLEIIIVDDCSPALDGEGGPTGYREQLQTFADADDRIRLHFNEVNRGSYSVRNDALDFASGEFVTVADKDDWHHPQQIQRQVEHLQRNPDSVGNMTNWARVDESLKLMLRSATGRVVYPSMPSLMFRREQVLRDIGYWDTVRKSGDSEFKSRMENFYGSPIEVIGQAPLAFALMEGQNLTKDDMGVGYLAPDRRAYLRAYKRWHRDIREEGASPFLPKNAMHENRRFIAPPSYLPGGQDLSVPHYDVVFASEFGFVAGNSTSLFTEISVCLEAGLRVAVVPFQNGLIPSAAKRQFNRRINDLILEGKIDRISLDTEARSDLLIVRWPTALQAVRDAPALVNPRRAVVVANHPPFEPGGRRSYDIGVVTRNIERLFGVRPTWAPQSEQIGAMIEPVMPASDLEGFSWKGIIELKPSASRNRFEAGRDPVIGRHGRDDSAKWPSDGTTFRHVYPVDGSRNVCILGGTGIPTMKGFLPRNPTNWEVYAFNEIEVDQYLSEKIDFFVYFHSDDWVEAFGMAILEAMSYGVVCVLPYHFEPVFGKAAAYSDSDQVQQVVDNLWSSEQYSGQRQNAIEFIEAECSKSAYIRRLNKFGIFA